jgi:hypothetical protein
MRTRYLLGVPILVVMLIAASCANQPSLTPASSDADIGAAAAAVRARHVEGGEAMWKELAAMLKPGMSVRHMNLLLPPLRTETEKEGMVLKYVAILIHRESGFTISYHVEKSLGVLADVQGKEGNWDEMILTSPPVVGKRDR